MLYAAFMELDVLEIKSLLHACYLGPQSRVVGLLPTSTSVMKETSTGNLQLRGRGLPNAPELGSPGPKEALPRISTGTGAA